MSRTKNKSTSAMLVRKEQSKNTKSTTVIAMAKKPVGVDRIVSPVQRAYSDLVKSPERSLILPKLALNLDDARPCV